MKKIALPIVFSSTACSSKKTFPIQAKKMIASIFNQSVIQLFSCFKNDFATTNKPEILLLRKHSRLSAVVFCFTLVLLTAIVPGSTVNGQTLATFPSMEGGFEAALTGNQAATTVGTGVSLSAWTGANLTNSTPTINTATVRSGTKSLSWLTSSTSGILFSQSAATTAIANATSYVVQFYWFKGYAGSARAFGTQIGPNGTTNLGSSVSSATLGTSAVSATWAKECVVVTSGTNAASPRYGLVQFKPSGGSFSASPGYLVDDFVVYPGSAADVTPYAAEVTAPSATYPGSGTSLNLSWTGITLNDGGGYVVVRYTSDPTGSKPNDNGIYVVGNTAGTGTVAYIGTGTSFTDPGLSAGQFYYYRVYTVDKAFNYSANPITFGGLVAAATTPALTLSMPGVPAASLDRGSISAPIYQFNLSSTSSFTTLSQLTFQNTSAAYNGTDFLNFKLYASTTNSFPGGTPLATINAPAAVSPQTFTGFSTVIPAPITGATVYFWITADVSATAVFTHAITVTPDLASGNLTLSGSPTVTLGSVTASGAQTIVAPAQYTWAGGASASWIAPASWSPARNTLKTSDELTFNSGGAITATNFPTTETIGQLTITGTSSVTIIPATTGNTLTVLSTSGLGLPDFTINAGSALTMGSTGNALNMTLGTGTTADISGVLNIAVGTYNTNGVNAITTVTNAGYPATVTDGIINNSGTLTSTSAAKLVIKNGAIYNHAQNGGTIPTATWITNSTCLISGTTSAGSFNGHRQTFSKFIWDCPSQGTGPFVLGQNSSNTAPSFAVTDSLIVKRTNGKILQLTSSGGQRDITVGNFFQYGGLVAITYQTDDGGTTRSLTVNNTCYVTDSLEVATELQIINQPSTQNIVGLLNVKGNLEMHKTIAAAKLSSVGTNSKAELDFTGAFTQNAVFNTIIGDIDFVTNNVSGVMLLTNATAKNFKLTQGTFNINSDTLLINGAVSYPAPGTGTLGGISTSNLTMGLAGAAGTLNFLSSSNTLKDFTQLAGNTVSLGTALAITAGTAPGRDSIGAGATLTTNDNLILRSDINGTARMAKMTPTSTIIGKVTVERYLPMALTAASRRWRLLTAPFKTTNAPTINAAWQEGASSSNRLSPVDPKPGYGTQITKSTTWTSDGYDQGSTSNPSIFYYSNGSNTWLAPANTNSVKITDNSGCYMLFARGDRSIVVSSTSVAAAPTTLDPKGELNVGDVPVIQVSSGYQTVGNPYASQIKIDNIDFNGTLGKSKTIYLWDPKQVGSTFNVGKFITCSGDGAPSPTYTYTGNASAYGTMPGVIESSGTFMVQGTGGNITFHESDKTMVSSTIGIASRPVRPGTNAGTFGVIKKLYADLLITKDGQTGIADGVAVTFNKNYKNSIDEMDAVKLSSFSTKEDLSIRRETQLFSIERRTEIDEADTVFLNIAKLAGTEYQFGFRPVDFDNAFTAYLEDKFLHTSTEINLAANSVVAFSITTEPESFASNRFQIVFKRNASIAKAAAVASIYPNPVTDGKINLQMEDMPEGIYGIKLMTSSGQVVYNSKINHQKGSGVKVIDVKNIRSKGIYHLEIISATNTVTTLNVSIQ